MRVIPRRAAAAIAELLGGTASWTLRGEPAGAGDAGRQHVTEHLARAGVKIA